MSDCWKLEEINQVLAGQAACSRFDAVRGREHVSVRDESGSAVLAGATPVFVNLSDRSGPSCFLSFQLSHQSRQPGPLVRVRRSAAHNSCLEPLGVRPAR